MNLSQDNIMDGYLRSITVRVGSDLGYDTGNNENMFKAVRLVQTSLTVGLLFSTNLYFWFNSLSLISIVAGSLSAYIFYCQVVSLYCQSRLLQNPNMEAIQCQREVSLVKSYILSRAYHYVWYLIDYFRLINQHVLHQNIRHQEVPTFDT
jgi:hypothetical protein